MLRFLTAGESHGPGLTAIVEGLPAGLPVDAETINHQLRRRQQGYGRGGRQQIEQDQVAITAGVRGGKTLGGPVCLVVTNRDWANWEAFMDPSAVCDLETRRVTRPRPGHADLAGGMKYDHDDLRNILERSSARETAARVAAGAVAAALLAELDIAIASHVTSIGRVSPGREASLEEIMAMGRQGGSLVGCVDEEVGRAMQAAIDAAREAGDTLGGVFEVIAAPVPPGLGSHVHWDRRLDGRLAQAMMSIPAIKGVEIGWGFRAAREPGSMVHDAIFSAQDRGIYRRTNHAGGLEGGITNGEPLSVKAAMKPIPTLMRPLASIDWLTGEPVPASVERADVCAVPAAAVVGEAMMALVLADAVLEKFGGDSVAELKRNYRGYLDYLRARGYLGQ